MKWAFAAGILVYLVSPSYVAAIKAIADSGDSTLSRLLAVLICAICLLLFVEIPAYIMFGKESAGIPEEILVENQENCVRIPMVGEIRSLNLGNSVAIMLYEALRQNQFAGMNLEGHLHHLEWNK